MVTILFFGATAEAAGKRRMEVDAADKTVSELFREITDQYPALARHKLHVSINEQYAAGHELVNDGDKVAIFTAVSGG
jgi:molybdopterin converting factor small subunit